MSGEPSLEGWVPVIGRDATLEEVVDLAFDYRGDVTVICRDGRRITGYVYNRDRHASPQYLQLFEPGGASHTLHYADILSIAFTGKDPAAAKSWEAGVRRKTEVAGA